MIKRAVTLTENKCSVPELCFASWQTAAPMDKKTCQDENRRTYGRKNLRCNYGSTAGHIRTVGIQALKRAVGVLSGGGRSDKGTPDGSTRAQRKRIYPVLRDGTAATKKQKR